MPKRKPPVTTAASNASPPGINWTLLGVIAIVAIVAVVAMMRPDAFKVNTIEKGPQLSIEKR